MSLESGHKLAHYEVVASIGAGGMGEVYRARDTKLGREVAIKVLPQELARDEERADRFEREARLLAQLNHPNIATLHGLEQHDGQQFLVMELVEGETLAERIAQGPVPVKEAIPLFIQIAEGLEAAHEKGIIHRDLKPANIKIDSEGKPKILDFGLAKAFVGDSERALDSSQSPTLTKDTALGAILGTAAYMSPEQARGKVVDKRTDVWAFGCCFYETLTGTRPFEGETIADVIGAVVHKEPDWSRVPASVEKLVRRCLNKGVKRRLQAIGDARLDLEDVSASSPTPVERTSPGRHRVFATGLALGALLVSIVAWALWPSTSTSPATSSVPQRLTSNPIENSVTAAAISADGRYLAFRDGNGLFVRMIETGETHQLETPDGFEIEEIDWYPDGSSLLLGAVVEGAPGFWRISVLGGEPRRIGQGAKASFSPDGSRIAYFVGEFPYRSLFVMGEGGEDARELMSAVDGSSYSFAAWSAKGDWVLYGKMSGDLRGSIEAVRADGSETRIVLDDGNLFQSWTGVLPFCWTPDDRLVYTLPENAPNRDSSNLWSVAIDPSTLELYGEPKRLTHLTGYNPSELVVTRDGARLGFLLEKFQSDVYVSELQGQATSFVDTRRLTFDDRDDYPSGWLADSRTVLLTSNRAGLGDPYRQHLDEGVATSLHSGPLRGYNPRLSDDGAGVLFFYGDDVMRVPVAGGPPERVWTMRADASWPELHCVPGIRCVYGEREEESQEYVFFAFDFVEGRGDEIFRLEDRPPFVVWALSPDGKTVAVVHYDGNLRLVDLEAETVEEIHDDRWRFGEFVAWDAFGNGVFTDSDPTFLIGRSFRKQLVYVQLGESPEVHLLRRRKDQWHIRPVASPDGRYLAYGVVTFSSNAWMLEDF